MNKTIFAYELIGIDNHSYFFENAPSNTFCSNCGSCINYDYIPSNFYLKNKSDFSYCYDGGKAIISSRFKQIIEKLGFEIFFQGLNPENSLFSFEPNLELAYHAMQQNNLCSICHQYYDQVAPIPRFNHILPIKDGIFKSNLRFGSGIEKNSIIIIGTNTYEILKKAKKEFKLRGIDFSPII